MESGLIFNQLICEFESRHPCQTIPIANFRLPISGITDQFEINWQIGDRKCFLWVVAQLAEHRTVTAAREGSTPFDPPKTLPIAD